MTTSVQDAAWAAAVGKSPGKVLTSPGSDLANDHRQLRDDDFWRRIPAYSRLSAKEFNDHRFQGRNSITSVHKLREVLGGLVTDEFCQDAERGVRNATMSVRISPYIVSLIDWSEPYGDPLRTQFLPLASRGPPRPPRTQPRLPERTGRLPGTRSHASLPGPGTVPGAGYLSRLLPVLHPVLFGRARYRRGRKGRFGVNVERWEEVFSYVARHPELEDIVISGGDAYNLKPATPEAHRRPAARHRSRPQAALCDQGAGGHAAEAADG